MITKGKSVTGRSLAAHLMKPENERVEIWEISGTLAHDLDSALDNWQAFAFGTQCTRPIYHAQLNPDPNDRVLSPEEWEQAIAIFEKEMGLAGYPRAIVMHEKKGREHMHLVYSRFNLDHERDDLRAWSDSWNYVKHEKVSRAIERALGLEKTQGVFIDNDGPRPDRTLDHDEMQRGARTKIDAAAMKRDITALYRTSDSGPAFAAALEDAGYTLFRGDRGKGGCYAFLDPAGEPHSLARYAGVRKAELTERMRDLPLAKLPDEDRAREFMAERDRAAWEDRLFAAAVAKEEREQRFVEPALKKNGLVRLAEPKPEKELNATAGGIRLAYSLSDSPQSFAAALNERGLLLAEVSQADAEHSQRAAAFAKELGRFAPILHEGELVVINERGHLYRLNERTTGESRADIDKFLGPLNRAALPDVAEARVEQREIAKAEFKAQRYETHDLERQAFMALSAVGLLKGLPPPDPAAVRAHAFKLVETIQEHGGKNPSPRAVEETLQSRAEAGRPLDPEQKAALLHATENGFAVIQGRAGTGKSFTLDAVRETYERAGFEVIGLAFTHSVVNDLREAGFDNARTLSSFLGSEQRRIEQGRPAPQGQRVYIVDEAGMVSDNDFAKVLEATAAHGARAVFAGDDRQLKSIEKGGLYAAFAAESSAELTTVYRQRDDWQKDATRAFGQGDTAAGLEPYHERGFIHYTEGDRPHAAADLVKQWVADRDAGREGTRFVLAVINADAHEINTMIQAEQIKAGLVTNAQPYTVMDEREICIGEGDRVQLRGNDWRKGLFNGMLATVEKIDAEAPHLLNVRLDNGVAKTLDTNEYTKIQLGYAGTVYRGQGKTLDRSYVLFSPYMDARAAYVADTRAREETHLYAATDDLDARYYRGHIRAEGLAMPKTDFEKLVAVIESRTAYNEWQPALEVEASGPAPPLAAAVESKFREPDSGIHLQSAQMEAAPVAIMDGAKELASEAAGLAEAGLNAADRVASGVVEVLGKGAEIVAAAFENLLGGPPPQQTPEQRAQAEARAEALQEAREQRTKTAADRWREAIERIKQEQEQGQEKERDARRRRERDNERER